MELKKKIGGLSLKTIQKDEKNVLTKIQLREKILKL